MSATFSAAQIEEMRPGARNAINTCMGVTARDRVAVITDDPTQAIGQVILEEAMATGAHGRLVVLEQYTARPIAGLPALLWEQLQAFAPTVTFYAASSQPGEVAFRMALRERLLQQLHVRHGHMPGVNYDLMVQGMRTDYRVVSTTTQAVYDLVRVAQTIHVTTPDGTDLTAGFVPELKWVPCTGLYTLPDSWGNLPEGETYTCPHTVNGILVVHLLGDYFSQKFGVLAEPVTIEVRDSLVTDVRSGNPQVAEELLRYLDSSENGRRAGEFAIGTNVGLKELVGNLLQDEKLPGVHVAFGNPYPGMTGARWNSNVHVDVIPVGCTIMVDNQLLMRDGQFDFNLLGLPAPHTERD